MGVSGKVAVKVGVHRGALSTCTVDSAVVGHSADEAPARTGGGDGGGRMRGGEAMLETALGGKRRKGGDEFTIGSPEKKVGAVEILEIGWRW